MNNNTEGINDEQLAYLNDNLNPVSECVNIYDIANPCIFKDKPVNCIIVNRDPTDNGQVIIRGNDILLRYVRCCCVWRDLFQLVEDRANTPPIFK